MQLIINIYFLIKSIKTKEISIKKKSILIPLILITISTLFIAIIDYSIYYLQNKKQINTYNTIKSKEIKNMANFLNTKYNLNIKDEDCIYYREEDYTRHSDILGNGWTNNIPYIAVFKNDNEEITVADRNGFISDNKKLKDINTLLINYFF